MGDPYQYQYQYQYPVFFDCLSLDTEQKKRIETYFQTCQQSGGGDCSSLKNIKDNTYRIDFKDRDAQQRILQKSKHVLDFGGGPVVLTVRERPIHQGKPLNPVLDFSFSQGPESAQEHVQLRGFSVNTSQASFYPHVAITNDGVTAVLGGVKLQIVNDNIIHETTDVIVNTTNFSKNQFGVSKAILTAAGPTVEAEFAQVGVPSDRYHTTGPGLLDCKEIIHASFRCDQQIIRTTCIRILTQCESKGYCSAAFPAINTGAAKMDSVKACKAMLDGMTAAITDLKPKSLSLIRIVILDQAVYQAFRSEVEKQYGGTATPHLTLRASFYRRVSNTNDGVTAMLGEVKLQIVNDNIIHETTDVIVNTTNFSSNQLGVSKAILTAAGPTVEAEFAKVGVPSDRYHTTGPGLLGCKEIIHASFRCMHQIIRMTCIKILTQCESKGYCSAAFPAINTGAAKMDSVKACKAMLDGMTAAITDLKPKFLSLIRIVILDQAVYQAFRSEVEKQYGGTATPHLTLRDGAHSHNEVSVDVTAPEGMKVTVNLRVREATNWMAGATHKGKRNMIGTTLVLPAHWEPMEGETFKKIELQPSSPEYQGVAQGFLRTAKYNICKIERVQNAYLWHAYTVCRERILTKNGPAELGEMSLYHGTSAGSCDCIEKNKFDRAYAGQHAALFGKGVYFAVNADYSAGRYSPLDASGLKRLYVTRVLTGRYTVGNSQLKAAPPRGSDPTDCYDSVVDNRQLPNMYVIFHDDQAYPEYLITFKQ
ncbi:protein mono-ADP-ribosyltransferase PARP14-like isoform X2 [Xyrichtys novacula]|uniref:Poly [ADP-ribose] polymerase n=1 Tax=Xyrichtys novacula TaxID=13765 RepID=A0AAV1HL87_XYRNO|nr:protein mono-ADP-ribosyltransferase PARP14-like isoform X2 [Xyrichtys novacula]